MDFRSIKLLVRKCLAIAVLAAVSVVSGTAQTIELDVDTTEAWLAEQSIRGSVSGEIQDGTVSVNANEYAFEVEEGHFAVDVMLSSGENTVVACAETVCSDTSLWSIGYTLEPEVYAYAEVNGRDVALYPETLESPNGPTSSYAWSADADNPAAVSLSATSDSTVSITIADSAPHGEYYFDLAVTDVSGAKGRARTYVTVGEDGVKAFDIRDDHAAWIDRAIVYEVTPYIFERNGKWRDVTARLDELARLGINTLWIQPVFDAESVEYNEPGQGYGIVNYFELRDDLGSEEDLRELVRSAKEDYGMRVLFDFPPSHTAILHRYAQDVLARGDSSRYYGFYMTEPDDAPYSQHYNQRHDELPWDNYPFYNYFWQELVILNWDNPEVYRWMREAGQKWIEDFDIDGYRIDAVWGVNARTPEAMQKWRLDLKRIKPEIFLLGEAPAARSINFEERFDAAYDWYAELGWVSHWTWQTTYSETASYTVFNSSNERGRAGLLRRALTNNGQGYHPDAKVFRFMENNDTERFFAWHTLKQTKMAATLLFTLPGVPMIYNGQEIGAEDHPYQTRFIFAEGRSVSSLDRHGLLDHYKYLTWLRSSVPALYGSDFDEVPVSPEPAADRVFAYLRSRDGVHVIGAVNMLDETLDAELHVPTAQMSIDASESYYVTDLMTGDVETRLGAELETINREIPGYTTDVFAISSERFEIPVSSEPPSEVPAEPMLTQNYPNPFNPSTTISFSVPEASAVTLRIFDVLGREVTRLVDGRMGPGAHTVRFDAEGLASGAYFYRLEVGDRMLTRQMLLSK